MKNSQKVKTRILKNIDSGIRQLTDIQAGFDVGDLEIAQVRAAAKQAEQALAELNKLIGILEYESASE